MTARSTSVLSIVALLPQKFRIDAAWTRLAHNGPTRVTREAMLKAGTTSLRSKVRYPDRIGGDFVVSLKSAYQMHCLAGHTTPTVRSFLAHTWVELTSKNVRAPRSFVQGHPEVARMHLGEYSF